MNAQTASGPDRVGAAVMSHVPQAGQSIDPVSSSCIFITVQLILHICIQLFVPQLFMLTSGSARKQSEALINHLINYLIQVPNLTAY